MRSFVRFLLLPVEIISNAFVHDPAIIIIMHLVFIVFEFLSEFKTEFKCLCGVLSSSLLVMLYTIEC